MQVQEDLGGGGGKFFVAEGIWCCLFRIISGNVTSVNGHKCLGRHGSGGGLFVLRHGY